MDAIILCGGHGSRIARLWDRPKCLVPYKNSTVLEHLLLAARNAGARRAVLLLAKGAESVLTHLFNAPLHLPWIAIAERGPSGIDNALRLIEDVVVPPFLVLNGDTVPLYSLGVLNRVFSAACYDGVYSGACLIDADEWHRLLHDYEPLTSIIALMGKAEMCPFIDVGTPRGFLRALETIYED